MYTAVPQDYVIAQSLLSSAEDFKHSKMQLYPQHLVKYYFKYVTGFWKTDRNVTFGQLHFLGPANSHTHTLSMHCCNTRLSCLVCFSRVDFADHVKPRLRQWDPWRALDGRYGSDIHPFVSETSHRPFRLVKAYDWHFLDS